MISLQEAISIAEEHCEGDVLERSFDTIIVPSSKYPYSWSFTIYHKDYNGNTFQTIIEVNRFGTLNQWYKILISDGAE